MAGYMDELTEQQLKHMNDAIDEFLRRYKTSRNDLGDQQKTVLFFPGGLGSELSRADHEFGTNGGNYGPYDQFWYDVAQILGWDRAALWLQMRRENGVDFDSEKRFIVASGEFSNCLYRPYDGFVDWCRENSLDLLVCSWDNRRNPEWVVRFFMDHLPDYVRQRAAAPPHNINTAVDDPLANVYLIGHSEGGHLIKWILNEHTHAFCQNVRLAVTVATAFYGEVSQCHRMFEGSPLVGTGYKKSELAKAIATMPGGYVLFFLDEQTYADHKDEFEADVYPLWGYPSLDADDGSPVDPYVNARSETNEYRYHSFGWDLTPYIDEGFEQFKRTVQDLHPSMKDLFHNIRGVQVQGGADYFGTPGSLTWRWFHEPFDLDTRPSPIQDSPNKVPGDGVVPAWSARLLPAQEGHVHTIWGDERYFEHTTLLESDGVLEKLWELLQTGQPRRESQLIMARREIEPAPLIELKRTLFEINEIAERAKVDKKEKKVVDEEIRAYVRTIEPNRQKALIKRWFIDMAKGPRTEEQDPPKEDAAPKKASPKQEMDSPKKMAPAKK